jgi:predicted Zn-dependent protease
LSSFRLAAGSLLILLVSLCLFGCGSSVEREEKRLEADQTAVAELKRIAALLGTTRPVTRIELDSLESLRTQYPASPYIRQLMHGALIRREDWGGAEKVMLEIPEAERTAADKLTLAKIYVKLGRFGEAVQLLKTIQGTPAETVEATSLLGNAQFYIGDIDEARRNLEAVQAQLIAQKRGGELAILGTIYFRAGDNGRAIDVLQKAVDVAPENISVLSVLSRVYAAAGDDAKAAAVRARLEGVGAKIANDEKKRSRIVPLFYQLEDAYAARDYEKVVGLVEQIKPDADQRTTATLYQYLAAAYKAQGKESEANQALAEAARLTQK